MFLSVEMLELGKDQEVPRLSRGPEDLEAIYSTLNPLPWICCTDHLNIVWNLDLCLEQRFNVYIVVTSKIMRISGCDCDIVEENGRYYSISNTTVAVCSRTIG